MTPKTRKLDLAEIMSLQEQEDEAWQEQLKAIARGEILGFVAEIVPEEVPGYGMLPDREFKMRLLDRTHALFNAIKHRLTTASEAAEGEWNQWVTAKRKDALVRVWRLVGEDQRPVELPEAFKQKLLTTQVRSGRNMPAEERKTVGERRTVGRTGMRQQANVG